MNLDTFICLPMLIPGAIYFFAYEINWQAVISVIKEHV